MHVQIAALRDLHEKRKALTGGRWVTINGAHVYVKKGGKIAAGPSGLKKAGKGRQTDGAEPASSSAPSSPEDEEPKGPVTKVKLGLLARLLDIIKSAFRFDAPDRELDTTEVEPKDGKSKDTSPDDSEPDAPAPDEGEDDEEPEAPKAKSKQAGDSIKAGDLDPKKLRDMSPDQLRALAKEFKKEAKRLAGKKKPSSVMRKAVGALGKFVKQSGGKAA